MPSHEESCFLFLAERVMCVCLQCSKLEKNCCCSFSKAASKYKCAIDFTFITIFYSVCQSLVKF